MTWYNAGPTDLSINKDQDRVGPRIMDQFQKDRDPNFVMWSQGGLGRTRL